MVRTCFLFYLQDEKEACKCANWAFGEGYQFVPQNLLVEEWNKLHGDLFILRGDGELNEDIQRIIKDWKASANPLIDAR